MFDEHRPDLSQHDESGHHACERRLAAHIGASDDVNATSTLRHRVAVNVAVAKRNVFDNIKLNSSNELVIVIFRQFF